MFEYEYRKFKDGFVWLQVDGFFEDGTDLPGFINQDPGYGQTRQVVELINNEYKI
ncbi:MAG: hypothetical protein ABIR66_06135 [Saprospiraceae bacterium]